MGTPSPPRVTEYDLNDLVRLAATYVSTDLVTPVNPSYVSFLARAPGGSVATYVVGVPGASVANPTTGLFYRDITASEAGIWRYRAVATGLIQANDEWRFKVQKSEIL